MSSIHFGVPSASTRPHIVLPPPRDSRSSLQSCPHNHHHHHHHYQSHPFRPSLGQRSSTTSSTSRHQPSSSSRPAFIPTVSGSSLSHWADQDPFASLPRPRRSVFSPADYRPPPERRMNGGPSLPFAPSPPTSQAGRTGSNRRTSPRRRRAPSNAPNNNTNNLPLLFRNHSSASNSSTSRAPASSPSVFESDSDIATMPAPRNSRKRRATEESSDPFESSPAPSTRSSKRLATARASTSSADRPEPSSIRAAAPKRKAPVKLTAAKKEPVEEPITFESSDIEEVEEVIDLVDKDVPDEPPKPKPENTVKLGQFQCVICMDDVTDLTVTHCGHLFCSECLHSSLHIDASKKVCPICRQKVETNPAAGKFTAKSKGFWPLELKLMTSKRSGKRAAS